MWAHHVWMRPLALVLTVAAFLAGCGQTSDEATAPSQEKVKASGAASSSPAGVAAKAEASPSSLCSAESGKARGQCISALKRAKNGASPAAACKNLSRKKAHGTKGRTPFALCVSAAKKLKRSGGKGESPTAKSKSKSDDNGGDDEADDPSADDSSSEEDDSSPGDDPADESDSSDDED